MASRPATTLSKPPSLWSHAPIVTSFKNSQMLSQQIVNALSLGGVYALFALGFTLIFGVLNVVNLAHGAVFMLGAYAALHAVLAFQLSLPAALLFAAVTTAATGWLLDRFIL